MVKNFYSCYKHENFHAKCVKHAKFNGTIFENISNDDGSQTGTKDTLYPSMGHKNLLIIEILKFAWELWFAIRLHNFYLKTLSQRKGSYQLLMKFMLLKSCSFHQKLFWGSTELSSRHFGQFLCTTWTSFLQTDPKFI